MDKPTLARGAAVAALQAAHKAGASAETALDQQIARLRLDPRDAALAAKLTFGVLQNRTLLDFYLGAYSHIPVDKLEPRVGHILRVAAYQILFLDRIPVRAAVDEAVRLTKSKNPRAAGLVNAVLRRLSEGKNALPNLPQADPVERLTIQYSHPRWLVQRFIDELGLTAAEALLEANNQEVPLYAQVNTLKTDPDRVMAELETEGVTATPHPWLADCLLLTGTGNPAGLGPFQDGSIYIQDPAAKLAALAADPKPGTRLLDACAAPGGKSFAAAMGMQNTGEIVAGDIAEKKLASIQTGAHRLGITIITAQTADARTLDPAEIGTFDTVIVDAPCSGLGIIRKKPEIRNKTPEELVRLPEIQLSILQAAARCVAPGGVLLYATCTVLREENGDVIEAFLAGTKGFAPEEFTLPGTIGAVPEGQITLYPHVHETDGFFFCKMRKISKKGEHTS